MTNEQIAVILHRLDDLDARAERIEASGRRTEAHTAATNARVAKLELWRARLEGARAAWSWLPTTVIGIIVGVTVAIATTLIA